MEQEPRDPRASAILKAYLALAILAAIAIGLALPIPHRNQAAPKASQFATFDIGSG